MRVAILASEHDLSLQSMMRCLDFRAKEICRVFQAFRIKKKLQFTEADMKHQDTNMLGVQFKFTDNAQEPCLHRARSGYSHQMMVL